MIDIARRMDDSRLARIESHRVGCSADLLILANLILANLTSRSGLGREHLTADQGSPLTSGSQLRKWKPAMAKLPEVREALARVVVPTANFLTC